MLKITDTALAQIKTSMTEETAGLSLRIAALQGDDGSIQYGMGFDEANEADISISHDEVKIVIDPTSNDLLEEATMDYVEMDAGQFHFIFMNPLDANYTPPPKERKKKDDWRFHQRYTAPTYPIHIS